MPASICLSAGHFTQDPGAVSSGLIERDLAIKITDRCVTMLQKHGLSTLRVPDDIDLTPTINWINQRASQIELCVEIHINAGGGHGMETWYYHDSVESKKLSQFINDACVAETGLPNRGVKDEATNQWGKLGFVHDTIPLACLVECGFIDGDNAFLKVDENLTRMSKGVARGIISYLGLKWTPELLNPVTTPTIPPITSIETELKKAQSDLQNLKSKVKKVVEILNS
ncbi:MAG: N-acetylmuramoyl-L-alanine amidase [Lutibacter sp.]|jgi:N-acetylmuramoyl-L-alanine amidase